ncbi:MAG: VTT domain-containing protein [Candidatus Aenigmatarchaeota archaeon]|nr:VTT domain-containing protein [Candidatus Aenigmarchaeota archaeon]
MTWANYAIGTYGYFGIAVVAAASTMSVFLPTFPLSLLVFLAAAKLNPIGVGIAAGVGSATGEMVSYWIARGGEHILEKKYKKQIHELEQLFQKYKGWLVIFFVGAIPIVPFDIMGLFAGGIHYDAKKFYLAALGGKTVRYIVVALAGYFGIHWVLGYFS